MIVSDPRRPMVGPESFPGLPVASVEWTTDADGLALDVQFADGYTPTAADMTTVQAVVQSLDDTEQTIRANAWQAADALRNVRDSTGDLTVTQLSNAARLFARVLLALLRLQLRRLDSTT